MKIYDKAQWHIDAGENVGLVIARFQAVLEFLDLKGWLDSEGKEIMELGVDSSVSLHERMLTDAGRSFMEACYDKVINQPADEMPQALEQEYRDWKL